MAYRMKWITDTLRVGVKKNGDFHLEYWPEGVHEGDCEEIFLPKSIAIEAALEVLRNELAILRVSNFDRSNSEELQPRLIKEIEDMAYAARQ